MFGDGSLAFREFIMGEPLPLATIQDAVLEFLRGRTDAALFGAQAVNAYVDESRMTQDVDILSTRAAELAEELRSYLAKRFHAAIRIREVKEGKGFRIYQVHKPRNRHLVDVRPVECFPPFNTVENVLVIKPEELLANKVIAYKSRIGSPKSFTDRRDLALLFLTFPELKDVNGPVRERLVAAGADAETFDTWAELAAEEIRPENDEDEFN